MDILKKKKKWFKFRVEMPKFEVKILFNVYDIQTMMCNRYNYFICRQIFVLEFINNIDKFDFTINIFKLTLYAKFSKTHLNLITSD